MSSPHLLLFLVNMRIGDDADSGSILVRVGAVDDAVFHSGDAVSLIVDIARPFAASVQGLMLETRDQLDVDTFLAKYELFYGSQPLDLAYTARQLQIPHGANLILRSRHQSKANRLESLMSSHKSFGTTPTASPRASAFGGHVISARNQERSAGSVRELLRADDVLRLSPGGSGSSAPLGSAVESSTLMSISNILSTSADHRSSPVRHVRNGALTQPAVQHAFDRFLDYYRVRHLAPYFAAQRILSLGELCTAPNRVVANALSLDDKDGEHIFHSAETAQRIPIKFDVAAFLLVDRAHEEMKRLGMVIDYGRRIAAIFEEHNSDKLEQLPAVMQAYLGEEEPLWTKLRIKYESAVVQAMEEATSQGVILPFPPNLSGTATEAVDSGAGIVRRAIAVPVQCPACRHTFRSGAISIQAEQAHVRELDAAQRELDQEKRANRVLLEELNSTIEQLGNRANELESERNHLRRLAEEQQQWIVMLEQKARMGVAQSIAGSSSNIAVNPMETAVMSSQSHTAARSSATVSEYSRDQRMKLRRKVVDFYLKHCPEKLEMVDYVMQQWAGKESELERLVMVQPSIARLEGSSVL